MPDASDQEVWDALPLKMASYSNKLGLVKSGRWFSLNEQGHLQMQEFTASRMVLEYYLQPEESPDDASQRELNFGNLSGLKLAYAGHSWRTFENLSIVLNLQLPLWDYYSDTLHFVKSAQQGLEHLQSLGEAWEKHWTLHGLAQIMASEETWRGIVQWSEEPNRLADRTLTYGMEVLAKRCASLSKLGSPPEFYAGLLSTNPASQTQGLQRLRSDFKLLLRLESSAVPGGPSLAADLRLTHDLCVRFTAFIFQASGWQADNPTGLSFLRVLLSNFADSKIVEDSHQHLRDATGSKANKQLKGSTVQQVLMDSNVLEERNIAHPAKTTKQKFLSLWHRIKPAFKASEEFVAARHKLDKSWSKVIGPKTWSTVSEVALVTSAAGWAYLRHYASENIAGGGVKLQVNFA